MAFHIIYSNAGGEIDRETCEDRDQLDDAMDELIGRIPIDVGDSIRVMED
jgi:hypothetical protein